MTFLIPFGCTNTHYTDEIYINETMNTFNNTQSMNTISIQCCKRKYDNISRHQNCLLLLCINSWSAVKVNTLRLLWWKQLKVIIFVHGRVYFLEFFIRIALLHTQILWAQHFHILNWQYQNSATLAHLELVTVFLSLLLTDLKRYDMQTQMIVKFKSRYVSVMFSSRVIRKAMFA